MKASPLDESIRLLKVLIDNKEPDVDYTRVNIYLLRDILRELEACKSLVTDETEEGAEP